MENDHAQSLLPGDLGREAAACREIAEEGAERDWSRTGPWRYLGAAGKIAPSPVTLGLVLLGFGTELVLLKRAGDPRLEGMGLGCALAMMGTLWLAAGWLLWGVLFVIRHSASPRWQKLTAFAVVAFVVYLFSIAYFSSWGTYLQAGAFTSYESFRYLFTGYQFIFHVIVQSTPAALALFAGLCVLMMALIPLGMRWMVRSSWPAGGPGNIYCLGPAALVMLFVSWSVLERCVMQDQSGIRRDERRDLLAHGVNPLMTFLNSYFECTREGEISPTLITSHLIPLPRDGRRPIAPRPSDAPRPDIYFLAVESLRADVLFQVHQGREVAPNLNALARRSVVFTRAYAQSTHTDYALVSCLSSLYPLRSRQHHFYSKSDPYPKTMVYDLLKADGYRTAVITSDNTTWGRMRNILHSDSLDLYLDAETGLMPTYIPARSSIDKEFKAGVLKAGTIPDHITMDYALAWLDEQHASTSAPIFLHTFFQDAHWPYEIAEDKERPFQPCEIGKEEGTFTRFPSGRLENYRNAYLNAVHEVDKQIARLIAYLDQSGRTSNSIVVICGDHGEAFMEHGLVTHAGPPVEVVIRVPMLIFAPGFLEPKFDDYPVQQIDLVPTVCAMIGFEPHPNFQGINVLARDRPRPETRELYVHVQSGICGAESIIQGGRWKYWKNRTLRKVGFHDLQTDPQEKINLLEKSPGQQSPLLKKMERWRNAQLAYYAFPRYYLNYYPPRH